MMLWVLEICKTKDKISFLVFLHLLCLPAWESVISIRSWFGNSIIMQSKGFWKNIISLVLGSKSENFYWHFWKSEITEFANKKEDIALDFFNTILHVYRVIYIFYFFISFNFAPIALLWRYVSACSIFVIRNGMHIGRLWKKILKAEVWKSLI